MYVIRGHKLAVDGAASGYFDQCDECGAHELIESISATSASLLEYRSTNSQLRYAKHKWSNDVRLSFVADDEATCASVTAIDRLIDTIVATNNSMLKILSTNIVPFGASFWSSSLRCNYGEKAPKGLGKYYKYIVVDGAVCSDCGAPYIRKDINLHKRSIACSIGRDKIASEAIGFTESIFDAATMNAVRACTSIPSEIMPTGYQVKVPPWVLDAVAKYYQSNMDESMTLCEFLSKLQ